MVTQESNILKELNNKNIVSLYKILKTNNNVYMVYDYFDYTTLEDFLKKNKKLELELALDIFI